MKKKVLVGIILIALLVIGGFGISLCFPSKELTIDEILETKAYSYLSPRVKEYIKEYYEETGKVLLTKELAKNGETYLNPSYINYLDSDKKDEYGVIPSITAYTPKLVSAGNTYPSKFDLRNVDGKNFVTPNKDQGDEGLCWAYATASLLETHDLITKNKSYDSSAVLFSEKQMDYALSSNGIIGGNKIAANTYRTLSSGGDFFDIEKYLSLHLIGVENSWTINNNSLVSQNKPLEPNIVFNRDNVIYETGETTRLLNLNSDLDNVELNEAMRNVIKNAIYNYGGAIIDVQVGNNMTINNILNNSDYINVVNEEYVVYSNNYHALHVVGWDDDYEYGFCAYSHSNYKGVHSFTTMVDGEIVCNSMGPNTTTQKVTGKGAWILKNSWGNQYSYLYLPYDSFIDEIVFVNSYSQKNWDNNYDLKDPKINFSNETTSFVYSLDKYGIVNDEKVKKLKVNIQNPEEISIYFSVNGSDDNYTLLGNYSYDYAGYKEIDVENKNIIIDKNSKIKMIYSSGSGGLELFTSNINSNPSIFTNDYTYSIENESPSNANYLNIDINSYLRNISDNTQITYKIKNNEGEYLPNNAYEVFYNKSYNGIVTPVIKLYSNYVLKGILYLDALSDNNVLYTSQLVLEDDFMPILGSGTSDDPWQIENVRHFHMMKNADKDYYILKNDIDFDYDTHNPNGLLYNDGFGWKGISFQGNLDGNGKTIKNIKVSGGLFSSVFISKVCKFDTCGVHDLKVDNIEHNYASTYRGGIIDSLTIHDVYNANVDNLSATNVVFNSNLSIYSGGIAGCVTVNDYGADWINTIIKINNWYSDVEFRGTQIPQGYSVHHLGGLIGEVDMSTSSKMAHFSLNNAKTHAHFNLDNHYNKEYYISDIVGAINNSGGYININNVIGDVSYENNNNANVTFNAFVGRIIKNDGSNRINGVRSTLDYYPMSDVNITNYEAALKPYEIARSNYNGIEYYESPYYVYDEYRDGTTKIEFKDKFNVYGDKIPTLKKLSESYSEYYKNYAIRVGEVKSITDLISNDTNYRDMHVYKSFECDLDVCNNVTDETIISVPTLENEYKFTGLKTGITTLIIYDKLSGYLDTVTITVLNENDYVLGFDYNHDNLIGENRIITKNTEYGELPQISRTGYTFKGWFTEREDGIEIKSTDIFDGNSNITLYAHWEINRYTVIFNSVNGTSIDSQEVNYNEKVTRPSNPTKEGYTFKEWQLNGNLYDFDTLVTDNITLTAVYTINHYTVTFNSNGGSSIDSQEVNYNEKVTIPSNPTKKGYTFKEWQLNGNLYDFDTLVTDNITLTAVYTINQYTVTFDSNGGTSVPSQLVNHGDAITFVRPTREHYTFRGWQLNGEPYSISDSVTENMTLVAIWEIHQHTVTFDSNGGSALDSQEVNYNEIATRPTDPTRGGYQFKGWLLNGSPYNFDTPITGNITLTAVWEKLESVLAETLQNNSYTVTNNLVTGFTAGKTIQDIKNELGDDVTIETNNSVISTGAVIKKNNESFTVVVKGDLTGDGRINSGDLLQMRKHLLEDVTLTGAYKEAGIIESNGNIKSLDLLRLRQYLLGDYTFR